LVRFQNFPTQSTQGCKSACKDFGPFPKLPDSKRSRLLCKWELYLIIVPEPVFHRDLVTLDMIKDVQVYDDQVAFTVVLTTPASSMHAQTNRGGVS
jgi:hypothetical protein